VAVKIVRSVKRYNQSAKTEIKILEDVNRYGGPDHHIVHLIDSFTHYVKVNDLPNKRLNRRYNPPLEYINSRGEAEYICLVFEPLGKSLYEFIKDNRYKGFAIDQI